MKTELLKRNEVAEELTWKLEDIYASEEEWKKEIETVKTMAEELCSYKGRMFESAETLFVFLGLFEKAKQKCSLIYGYASKVRDTDMTASKGQELYDRASSLLTDFSEKLAFAKVEINQVEEELIKRFYEEKAELKKFERFLAEMRRKKAHSLDSETEKLLAAMNAVAQVPYNTFSNMINADMKFPEVTDKEGNKVQITNGRFVPLQESSDRGLRKEVFEHFYKTYEGLKNSIASLYFGQVKQLMFQAKARNYASTLEAALDETNVSPKVYENLIQTIHENMDKMHRYVRLRKKMLGVEELHMYDVYVPIVSDYEVSYTIEEAKDLVLKALEPLGEEYGNLLKKGFTERWIDVVENKGKRGGAYASGMYGVHPFVLLNFNGTLDNVFTLAHEMGHALHSYFSNREQNYLDSRYEIFVAEVASTTNEVLLIEYMLKHAKSDAEKKYLLNHYLNSFKSTVYRQTMFAEFEKKTNEIAEKGESLNAENLTNLYYALNKEYFGEDMVADELIGYEWTRIPHFYYNYYVYQYATGYSAAVSIAHRILNKEEGALENYLKFLTTGCTMDPVSLLRIAGVDMAEKKPIEEALKVFESVLAQMEELIK